MAEVGRRQKATADRLGDLVADTRRALFVGRADELAAFAELLEGEPPSASLVVVHGPGGVGKSTLLAAMADLARERSVDVAVLNGRDIEVTPPGLHAAVNSAVSELASSERRGDQVAGRIQGVLLFDTFETVTALEDWFFGVVVPELPAEVLVVVASREAPDSGFRAAPGLRSLTRVISLRNLTPAEAERYLALEAVPVELASRIAVVSFGHPLALALAADLYRRGVIAPSSADVDFEQVPDLVQALLQRLVDEVPSEAHRQALRVLALAPRTDQHTLGDLIANSDTSALFDWLHHLAFVDARPDGLVPHDVAREVLAADLRWRDKSAFNSLHRRLFRHFVTRARETSGRDQQRATAAAMQLSRHNARVATNWDADALQNGYADRLRPDDAGPLIEMARRHEGDESARLVEYWLDRQPNNVVVFRGHGPAPVGFVIHLALHDATAEDFVLDPGARSLWEYAQRNRPPRPGEDVTAWVFNIDDVHYQRVATPTWTLGTVVHSQRHFGLTRPSWEFFVYRDPEYWSGPMDFADLGRIPEADYELGGRRYAVFGRDWRVAGFADWLELMSERMRGLAPDDEPEPARASPLVVLDEQSFADAVRSALRDLHSPDRLAVNPLLRSRVAGAAGAHTTASLRGVLQQAAATLGDSPATEKFFRAVDRTYLRPAGTQERAAELLDLPFSTYRRHLGRGVDAIVALLWEREVNPPSGAPTETT